MTDIHCIKDAKVPLMKFKFDGVSIDLPFTQLKVISVPEVGVQTTHYLFSILRLVYLIGLFMGL